MIHPVDITPDTRDITALWRRMTGDRLAAATAHMRGPQIATVTVSGRRTLAMCRAGACALITPQAVAAIEAQERGPLH